MKLYAGIDLHSSNCYLGIIDEQLEKVLGKRFRNSLPLIIDYLAPYKKDLQGVVVESTYNWYWLDVTSEKEIAGANSRLKAKPSRMEDLKTKRKNVLLFCRERCFFT